MLSSALKTVSFLAAAAMFMTACDQSQTPAETDGSASNDAAQTGQRYVIGVVAKSNSNPVFLAAKAGAFKAAEDLSEQHGIDVQIDWRTPNSEDAQQQAQFLEALTNQGVDGIAISCTDANLLTPAIDAAASRGIYVATFDSDAPDSERFVYYGVDDKEAGAAVMEQLAIQLDGQGVVAVLAGNQAAPNLQRRVEGVREKASEYEGITIKDVYYHPETATDAVAQMQTVQTSNPDITGWALVGGWPLYTDNALDGIYENAKVVSLDPLPQPLQYLKAGQVQCLVGQPYFGWGYESVKMIVEKLHTDTSPASELVFADLEIVDSADEADELAGRWSEWTGSN